ncbi:MAG: ATP-binding cassette domain-containing protein [Muribaculaceae bacterium]|nr:ATP-binding cassette domain-containing protein [Muribaculaceae bacterium]
MNSDSFYSIEEEVSVQTPDSKSQNLNKDDTIPAIQESEKNVQQSTQDKSIIINYKKVNIDRGERQVLKNVDFELYSGEFCYLVGRVGSGKSSLMKTMYADIPIREALMAEILEYDLTKLKSSKIPYLRRNIGIVFQDFQLLQDRSVAANLRFVLQATGWKKKYEIEERIEEVLSDVGMNNKSYKMPHELSGGEQQRIVIARALLNRPKLILADEPTGNLDPTTGTQIVKLLHDLTEHGHSVVMATHNLQLVEDFPARVVECMNKTLLSH